MHELLILNGRVLDPGQNLDVHLDVGITGGRIVALEERIPESAGLQVIDASGKIVIPGLVDLHCHVYQGVHLNSNHPDTVGVSAGVTTVVDAGSAGSSVFGGLPQFVTQNALTGVYCFLNVARTGLLAIPEIRDRGDIDVPGSLRVADKYRTLIRGFKLRATGPALSSMGREVVTLSKTIASEAGLPLMVHIGQMDPQTPATLTREVLETLGKGDILSHMYTGIRGGILDESDNCLAVLRTAMARGVLLDVGHGWGNIQFDTARRLLDEGILPDTLSSDLIARIVGYPTYGSLAEVMSQFLALGLSLDQVVRMTTSNPARALQLQDEVGSIALGRRADLTILDHLRGDWLYVDQAGGHLRGNTAVIPALTVKSGLVVRVDAAPFFTKLHRQNQTRVTGEVGESAECNGQITTD